MRITFAEVVRQILRLVAMVEMLTKRHEKVAVVSLCDAAAIVIARR